LYPHATDLSDGDPLPDEDEVARYCSPSRCDAITHEPTVSAFIRGPNEDDLSVRRLQFYVGRSRSDAVACIRQEFENAKYKLKKDGRFAVFGVSAAQTAAAKRACTIDIVYTPEEPYPSHSSVLGLPAAPDVPIQYAYAVRVATALMRLLTKDDIYEAVP
jgi:hypothetical protein